MHSWSGTDIGHKRKIHLSFYSVNIFKYPTAIYKTNSYLQLFTYFLIVAQMKQIRFLPFDIRINVALILIIIIIIIIIIILKLNITPFNIKMIKSADQQPCCKI